MKNKTLYSRFLISFFLSAIFLDCGGFSATAETTAPPPPPIEDDLNPPIPPEVSGSTTALPPPVPTPKADGRSKDDSTAPPPPPVPQSADTTVPPPPLPADTKTKDSSPAPPPPVPQPADTASPPPPPATEPSSAAPPPPPPAPPETSAKDNATPPPAPTPAAPPAPNLETYPQGLALFKESQFQAAIPFLKQAAAQKPNDPKVYYLLGSAQYKSGHNREAVMNFLISCKLKPDLKLEDFARRKRANLTAGEVQWVDAQVAAFGTGKAADVPVPVDYPQFGLRVGADLSFVNMTSFKNEVQAGHNYQQNIQGSDPGYVYTGSVPDNYVGFTLEPLLRLESHLELGLPLSYLPVGTVAETVVDPMNVNASNSYAMSVFSGGLDVKVLAGDRPFQFFASAGPRMSAVQVDLNYKSPYSTATGSFNSTLFGGEVKVGLEWELADNFIFSPAIGYRWLQSGILTGNITSGGTTSPYRMEYDSNSTGTPITYIPSGSPDPAGMSPFNLDMSGPLGSFSFSALF